MVDDCLWMTPDLDYYFTTASLLITAAPAWLTTSSWNARVQHHRDRVVSQIATPTRISTIVNNSSTVDSGGTSRKPTVVIVVTVRYNALTNPNQRITRPVVPATITNQTADGARSSAAGNSLLRFCRGEENSYTGRSTRSAKCSSSIRRSAASIGCADARSRPHRLSTTTTAPSCNSAVSTSPTNGSNNAGGVAR